MIISRWDMLREASVSAVKQAASPPGGKRNQEENKTLHNVVVMEQRSRGIRD